MFNPPTGPTNGAEYTYGDVVWQYQNPPGVWNIKDGTLVGRNGTGVTGFRIDGSGNLYFYYVYHGGATSSEVNLGQVGGGAGFAFDDGITFRDSDDSVASGTRIKLGDTFAITGSGSKSVGVFVGTSLTKVNNIPTISVFSSVPIAGTSVTGVASFNSTDFDVGDGGVSPVGNITLDTGKVYFTVMDEKGETAGLSLSTNNSQRRYNVLALTGGNGIDVLRNSAVTTQGQFRIQGVTATYTTMGVASFHAGDFSVVSGAVSLTSGLVYGIAGATGQVTLSSNLVESLTITRSGNTIFFTPELATYTSRGVASYKSGDFSVFNGAVSLTSGLVYSFNGKTGNVIQPLAGTDGTTGVASFKNGDFIITNGEVSLTANIVNTINGATGTILAGAGDDKIVYTSTTGLTTSPTFLFDGNTLTFGGANTQMMVTGPTFAFGDLTTVKGGVYTKFKEGGTAFNENTGSAIILIDPRDGCVQKIKRSNLNGNIKIQADTGWSAVPNTVESVVVYLQQSGTSYTGGFDDSIISDKSVAMFGVTGGIDVFTITRYAVTSTTGLTMGFPVAIGLTGAGIAF